MPCAFPVAEPWEAKGAAVAAGAEGQAVVRGVMYGLFFPFQLADVSGSRPRDSKRCNKPNCVTLSQLCLSLPRTGTSISLPWASDAVWLRLPGGPKLALLTHQKDCSLPTADYPKFPQCVKARVKVGQGDVLTWGR